MSRAPRFRATTRVESAMRPATRAKRSTRAPPAREARDRRGGDAPPLNERSQDLGLGATIKRTLLAPELFSASTSDEQNRVKNIYGKGKNRARSQGHPVTWRAATDALSGRGKRPPEGRVGSTATAALPLSTTRSSACPVKFGSNGIGACAAQRCSRAGTEQSDLPLGRADRRGFSALVPGARGPTSSSSWNEDEVDQL